MDATGALQGDASGPTSPAQTSPATADGAYGLRFPALTDAANILVAAPSWPVVDVRLRYGTVQPARDSCDDHRARFALIGGGEVVLERQARRATFTAPRHPDHERLVHPVLSSTAAMMNRWLGRDAFHAGAFIAAGAAWGVLAHRGCGKSSTLAWLSERGADILTDDLLIVDDGIVYAGPRLIDLRAEAAQRLGVGEDIGRVGVRRRWRLTLPPVPPDVTLRGWIFLEWGEAVAVERMPLALALTRLAEHRALRLPFLDAARLLDLAALPSFILRRPRRWAEMEPALTLLEETIAGSRPPTPRLPSMRPAVGGRS